DSVVRLAGVEPATLGLEDEGRCRAGPLFFRILPRNRATTQRIRRLVARDIEVLSRQTRTQEHAATQGTQRKSTQASPRSAGEQDAPRSLKLPHRQTRGGPLESRRLFTVICPGSRTT